MSDFPKDTIEVRDTTDNWGPFSFDFSDSLPDGDDMVSVVVTAYLGSVNESSTLADETEITSVLIDTDTSPTVSSNIVLVYFVFPGAAYKGDKATLVFQVTLDSGATHPFFFHYVRIK